MLDYKVILIFKIWSINSKFFVSGHIETMSLNQTATKNAKQRKNVKKRLGTVMVRIQYGEAHALTIR